MPSYKSKLKPIGQPHSHNLGVVKKKKKKKKKKSGITFPATHTSLRRREHAGWIRQRKQARALWVSWRCVQTSDRHRHAAGEGRPTVERGTRVAPTVSFRSSSTLIKHFSAFSTTETQQSAHPRHSRAKRGHSTQEVYHLQQTATTNTRTSRQGPLCDLFHDCRIQHDDAAVAGDLQHLSGRQLAIADEDFGHDCQVPYLRLLVRTTIAPSLNEMAFSPATRNGRVACQFPYDYSSEESRPGGYNSVNGTRNTSVPVGSLYRHAPSQLRAAVAGGATHALCCAGHQQ